MVWIKLFVFIQLSFLPFNKPKASSFPVDHPRIYVTSADLSYIKKKLSIEPFKTSWNIIQNDSSALSLAFAYLIEQQKEKGITAIQKALDQLQKTKDIRPLYNTMMVGACVYDWCYRLLSQTQQQAFIHEFIRIAKLHSPGYPASQQSSSIVGHTSEGWLLTGQLPAGLAIYDENSTIYNAAAYVFFTKFVPARNFHYASHMHHQGDSYTATRFQHDIMASWLFRRAGMGDVFSKDQAYVPYQFIYHLRPDGMQLRSGDTSDDRGRSVMKRRVALFTASYYQDPYLFALADSDLFTSLDIPDKIFEILFRPVKTEKRPLSELPLTKYFPEPMGEMVARTGWEMGVNSSDAVVHMRIGNYFFGNHQHKDFGTFQLYFKGALATNSGIYGGKDQQAQYGGSHWLNYYHQTAAHNGLLIYDPAETPAPEAKLKAVNDGGQYWPNKGNDHPDDLATLLDAGNGYQMGKVIAHEFGTDSLRPDYSYIAGDITKAYRPEKVQEVVRSMVTLNTGNPAMPCVLVILDKVVATQAYFKKTWLLHSLQEPRVEENIITIVRDGEHYKGRSSYHGKLVVTTLLPKEAAIVKAGGEEEAFLIESTGENFPAENKSKGVEAGNWRVEVSPTLHHKEDMFLNVLCATEKDNEAACSEVSLLENQEMIGAKIANQIIYFSKKSGLLEEASINVSGDTQQYIFLNGLHPGNWVVKNEAGEKYFQVKREGKCAYIQLPPGKNEMYLNNLKAK